MRIIALINTVCRRLMVDRDIIRNINFFNNYIRFYKCFVVINKICKFVR